MCTVGNRAKVPPTPYPCCQVPIYLFGTRKSGPDKVCCLPGPQSWGERGVRDRSIMLWWFGGVHVVQLKNSGWYYEVVAMQIPLSLGLSYIWVFPPIASFLTDLIWQALTDCCHWVLGLCQPPCHCDRERYCPPHTPPVSTAASSLSCRLPPAPPTNTLSFPLLQCPPFGSLKYGKPVECVQICISTMVYKPGNTSLPGQRQ